MFEIELQIESSALNIPDLAQFKKWVELTLVAQNRDEAECTIRIVDETESQTLNKQYRNKDKPTNVLSFPAELPEHVNVPLLGDLVICAPVVETEAKLQQKAEMDHWAHLVIHGILHLLGYDHIEQQDAAKMEAVEIQLLAKLGISNPYEVNC